MPATYEDLSDSIDRVARKTAQDWPDVDWEDVRQELVLFVLEHGSSIKLKDEGGNPVWLLGRVARTYCGKQRVQHLSLSTQYAYRPSDVKKILETAFDAIGITDTHIPLDARSHLHGTVRVHINPDDKSASVVDYDPFKDVDAVEIASDVKAAYERLKPDERASIFRRYGLGEIPDNNSYERKKLNTAIKNLTHKLNTYRGRGPDAVRKRRAISNAGARASISEVYEG